MRSRIALIPLALCLTLACEDQKSLDAQNPQTKAEAHAEPVAAPTPAPEPEPGDGKQEDALAAAPTTEQVAPEEPAKAEPAALKPDAANAIGALSADSAPQLDTGSLGSGGLGLRGAGSGGGGESYGSIGTLGTIGRGGGKGVSGKMGVRSGTVSGVGYGSGSSAASARGQRLSMTAGATRRPSVEGEVADSQSGDDFKNHGVNPMTATAKDRHSTFAIDVDTGAYTIARRQLQGGALPAPSSVRVEEYVNYFAYNYPSPAKGAFSVSMEAAPSPFEAAPGRYLMRVGVQGKRIEAAARKPVHLTFLVDVSGSMSSPDKLPLAQESLKILTNSLREGDSVALVTYAGNTRVVLPATDAAYKGRIMAAIDDLSAGGSTAMSSGMELAYKEALASYKKGHVNRVIVLSDGDANVGNTNHQDILKKIKSYVDEGVTLSTIGFGMGNYKDHMMEQLANKGNGNYYYIDSKKEANKVFGEQVSGTLEVIAKDVKIQVEFDADKVSEYRLIGYENRDIRDQDFRNDKVDAGEIGAGHTVTAFYEVVFKGAPQAGFATVRVRHKQPEASAATEAAFVVGQGDMRAKLSEASKDFQFGAAVVAFAEILRGSSYARGLKLELVEELAQAASSSNQKDRQEFLELVRAAKKLYKG